MSGQNLAANLSNCGVAKHLLTAITVCYVAPSSSACAVSDCADHVTCAVLDLGAWNTKVFFHVAELYVDSVPNTLFTSSAARKWVFNMQLFRNISTPFFPLWHCASIYRPTSDTNTSISSRPTAVQRHNGVSAYFTSLLALQSNYLTTALQDKMKRMGF